MRFLSLILLILLLVGIMVPPSFGIMLSRDGDSALGVLDICHSSEPALSSDGEMPCINATSCSHTTTQSVSTIEPYRPLFSQLLISSQNEQPPKA